MSVRLVCLLLDGLFSFSCAFVATKIHMDTLDTLDTLDPLG